MHMSILIATYNRAEVLRHTLEAMCALDRKGVDVEFVVIDNNSSDNTSDVADSFKERLPIQHLFQPRQGKSAALNLALDAGNLGDIVVFTDDDVVPPSDWLNRIVCSCEHNADYDVFGGPICLIFPQGVRIPSWACSKYAQYLWGGFDCGK